MVFPASHPLARRVAEFDPIRVENEAQGSCHVERNGNTPLAEAILPEIQIIMKVKNNYGDPVEPL